MVDRIKVIKSAEEQELRKRAALMQDGAMKAAFDAVQARHARPRRRGDRAVLQPAQRLGERHLSLRLDAARQAAKFGQRHVQNRSSRRAMPLRCSSRILAPAVCSPSSAAPAWSAPRYRRQMKDELQFVMESRKLTLDLLKPGTPCKDIWETFNAFMR